MKYKEHNYNESEVFFRKALEENPENNQIKFNLSSVLYKSGKYSESKEILENILKNDSLEKELKEKIFYNLGNVFFRMGENDNNINLFKNSAINYQKAISINSDDKDAVENFQYVKNMLRKNIGNANNTTKKNSEPKDNNTEKNNNFSTNPKNNFSGNNRNITSSLSEIQNTLDEIKQEEENMQRFFKRRNNEQKGGVINSSPGKNW